MNKTEYSRLVMKRSSVSTVEPTIPTGETIDNSWLSTDLLVGEFFINIADDRLWMRTDNGLVEISMSGISSQNYYTDYAYLSGSSLVFDRTDTLAAYSVDLSTAYLPLTGGTLTGGLSGTSIYISSVGAGTPIINLGLDANGQVVTGTTGSGSSADLFSASTGTNSIIANNGTGNLASANITFAAGSGNTAASAFAVVMGGEGNSVSSNGLRGFIGAGSYNSLTGARGFIGAGQTNSNTGSNGFVGAGSNNAVQASFSVIVGGSGNFAKGAPGFAYVFAGTYNTASTENAAVITGSYNLANGINSLILAGTGNTITGRNSVILGGADINATADDTAYVPSLNIRTIGGGSPTINLGLDSSGNVVTGTTGGAGGGGTVQGGTNTYTGGSFSLTTVNVSGGTFNNITITGNTVLSETSATTVSILNSGATTRVYTDYSNNTIQTGVSNSSIVAGSGNTISANLRNVLIGGVGITASANDTAYFSNLVVGGNTIVKPTAGNYIGVSGSTVISLTGTPVTFAFAVSDETTAITSGTSKLTYYLPHAMTLTSVRACLTTSGSTLTTVDINEAGSSILSTKLTIDAGEYTSTTAASAPVISDASLADDAKITIDIDGAGTGAVGLKVTLIGYRSL